MGKTSAKSRLQRKLAKKRELEKSDAFSIDEILGKAENYVNEYNYELAQKFLQRALELDSDNVKALELSSTLLLEAGDVENAKHCLGRAITVQPDIGYSKYFALAQLFDGRDSLNIYEQGIIIAQRMAEAIKDEEDSAMASPMPPQKKDIIREISNAYCAIIELYITDLCDEEEAEAKCLEAINFAIQADESNPEAYQCKTRYLLIREKFDEAKEVMKTSLNLWLPKYKDIMDNKQEVGSFDPVEICPLSYMTRISTAKILIELEDLDSASTVLEGMIEEDDEVVDTWYLLGWLNHIRASGPDGDPDYNGNTRYYLEKAKKVHSIKPTDDQAIIEHIDEILNELGPAPQEITDEVEDNPENWEDLQSSDEEEDKNMEES